MHANSFEELPTHTNVPLNKTFTITMSQPVALHAVNDSNIYVKDRYNNVVAGVFIALDSGNEKKIIVRAPAEGYEANSNYTLYIENGLESKKGKPLLKPSKMAFTTGTSATTDFVPRANSLNNVLYTDEVVVLTEAAANTLIEGDVEDQRFVFDDNISTYVSQIVSGDIFVFPPTEQAPNGFAKKVESLFYEQGRVGILTSEPTFEEVVQHLDVSKQVAVTTDDFEIAKGFEEITIASNNSVDKPIKKIKNKDGTEATLEFKDVIDNHGFVIGSKLTLKNYRHFLPEDDKRFIPLNGSVTLTHPLVSVDATDEHTNYFSFNTGFEVNIDQTMSLAKFSANKRVDLPVQIPVKLAGVVGATIQPYIDFQASGNLKFGYTFVFKSTINAGFKSTEDKWEGFNNSTAVYEPKLHVLSGNMSGRLAAGSALSVEVLQFSLGGLEAAVFVDAGLNGEMAPNFACYSANASAGVYFGGFIGDHKRPIARIVADDLKVNLLDVTKCEMDAITADDLSIRAGESKQLTINATDLKGNEQPMSLPNHAITFTPQHEDLKVTKSGHVHVSEYAEEGQALQVLVTYDNLSHNALKKLVTIHVLPRDPNKPLTTPNLETSEPEPENKTYTIKEWNLSFDLLEDVGNYEISKVYDDYHILKNGVPMVYLIRYDKDYDPSFRGYWGVLGTRGNYTYYIRSGFNIFTDDENSPHFDEQADTFDAIVKSKKFLN